MKLSDFSLMRLDDFVAAKEREKGDNPFIHSPFDSSTEGNLMSGWEMNHRRLGLFMGSFGRNLFSKDEMILITVPKTGTGVKPLALDMPYGWDGKINSVTAELAVWWAFELTGSAEAAEFMRKHHPVVIFNYMDSDGPGEISVRYNGECWLITD